MPRDRRHPPRRGVPRPRRVALAGVAAAAVVAVVVAVVVQVGHQSLPYRRDVDLSYAALVSPLAGPSASTGGRLSALLGAAPGDQRAAVFSGLDAIATEAARTAAAARFASVPGPAVAAASGCTDALVERADAVASVQHAVEALLGGRTGADAGGGASAAATSALTTAYAKIRDADRRWAACRNALRHGPGLARVPASAWVTGAAAWSASSAGATVSAIAGSPSLAPSPSISIDAMTTAPPAVSVSGSTYLLPSASSLGVTVVVADTGNVDVRGVVVEVQARPTGHLGSGPPVRTTLDLAAGQASTVTLTGLRVTPGGTYDLVATASAVRQAHAAGAAGGTMSAGPISTALSVAQAASTTAVAPSANPVATGARVVYQATVAGALAGAPAPTGTVTFEEAGTPISACRAVPLVRGLASCAITYRTAGVHSITGVYSGTASIAGSTSPAITETVQAPAPPGTS